MFVACLGMLAVGCSSITPPSPEKVFADRQDPEQVSYSLADGGTLSGRVIGASEGPLVLFVHGSPGGWNDFAHLLANRSLADQARLVSVDRPGWGDSANLSVRPSLDAQVEALQAVLDAHSEQLPALVVGHSYGGPVAALLAMEEPERVGGLILVAGSIDPKLEKTTWFQKVSRWSLVRWMLPDALVDADREIQPLKEQLQELMPRWGELRMPVTVIQGEADDLVPPANADFAEERITGATPLTVTRVPDMGHLIPWNRPELVAEAVEEWLADAAR
ncbi:MAG: alpha/beta hydrolase [Acidobacteriota bacterium]|nr:alpha/beta hydrolase [Acidobacteriota bacterium]